MVMSAAERKTILGPDDLSAHVEAGSGKRILHRAGMTAGMPHVSDTAGKQRPCFAPIGFVVIGDFTEAFIVVLNARGRAPSST